MSGSGGISVAGEGRGVCPSVGSRGTTGSIIAGAREGVASSGEVASDGAGAASSLASGAKGCSPGEILSSAGKNRSPSFQIYTANFGSDSVVVKCVPVA